MHNLWFEEALTIWSDENAIESLDEDHSDSEDRFIRLGRTSALNIIVVVFCERIEGKIIRIINAGKATSKEREFYEEGI